VPSRQPDASSAASFGRQTWNRLLCRRILQPKEEIIMASPALKQTDFQPFDPSITTDFRSLSDLTSSLDEAPFITSNVDHQTISTADGLKGARAAMVAICVEVLAVLCIYGIRQLWHAFR
jgi:hypothetical protein